jgi:hypothetical protein
MPQATLVGGERWMFRGTLFVKGQEVTVSEEDAELLKTRESRDARGNTIPAFEITDGSEEESEESEPEPTPAPKKPAAKGKSATSMPDDGGILAGGGKLASEQ